VVITTNGTNYLSFSFPHPATNVTQALIDHNLYRKFYLYANPIIEKQSKLVKDQKKAIRREKIRRVLTFIGVGLTASATGFATGYIYRVLK
jgi:hypothetical protein